ncbi:MAG: hypothetical protein AAGA48_04665 [Myxococcota bacterium]
MANRPAIVHHVEGYDPIHIVVFDDSGGLLSYERAPGTFIHTLCTAEGFARKRNGLGLA